MRCFCCGSALGIPRSGLTGAIGRSSYGRGKSRCSNGFPGYTDSAPEREQRSSTALFYIALPHGNPALVRQTRLLVARMDVPVAWAEIRAVCAFLFAAETAVLRDDPLLFSTFYRKLSDPETEEQVRDLQMEGRLSDEEFRKQLIQLIACPEE